MAKAKSKRWSVLVGNYKAEKGITASPVQILASLELVHEYAGIHGDVSEITPHMKTWAAQKTGCSTVLAYDALAPGFAFDKWLAEKE